MSNMTRYDPFSIEPVTDLFQGLFRPLRDLAGPDAGSGAGTLSPMKVDVTESDTAYTVKAELPGIDKNDIDVQIEGNVVSIRAHVERNKEEKEGERVLRRERYSGSFSRSFTLAGDVDGDQASARYQDGVLSLTLPKKASSGQKRLPIM
ncbi:MAG TPA: Hsp20/alpha crystallin family protein [Paraburkholderia sp.]|jgi:HSP20 family protein|nr:Hsp20/alpha crystallin family protein [Paraburkholderia sp.]